MALDPSISLAVRPPQFNVQIPNPLEQFGQVLSLGNLMRTGQMTDLELQLKRMQLQETLGLTGLFTNPANPLLTTTSPTIPAPIAPIQPVPATAGTTPTLSNFMLGPPVGGGLGVPSGLIPLPAPDASPQPAAAPSDTTGQPTPTVSSVTGQPAAPSAPFMDRPMFGTPGYPSARQILTVAPTTGMGVIENMNKAYKSQLDTELAHLNLQKGNNEALGSLLNGVTDDESLKRNLVDAVRQGWMTGDDASRWTSLGFKNPYVHKRIEELKQQSLSVDKAVTTAIAKNKENRDQLLFPSQLIEQTGKGQQAELQSALSVLTPVIQGNPADFAAKLGNTDPKAGPVYSQYVQSVLSGAKTSKELAERGLTAQQSLERDLQERRLQFERQQKDPFNLFGLNPPEGAPAPAAGTAQPGTAAPGTVQPVGAPGQVQITPLMKAISEQEGFPIAGSPARANNNPGNLRAGPGMTGTDKNGFAIFPDEQTGWAALNDLIQRHSGEGLTLNEFIGGKPKVYPGYAPAADRNDPVGYARTVAGKLNVDPNAPLSSITGVAVAQPVSSAQPAPSIQALIRDPNLHGQALLNQLNQLSPTLGAQVKAISEGRADYPNVRALATAPGQTIAALVAQYDPSFDVKNPAIRQATARAFTSGEEAHRVTALNTSAGLLNDLSLAADRLKNGWNPIYNTIGNFLNTQKGYGVVKDFDTAKAALLSQLPTAVKGDVKMWERQINSADSPEALHRVLARMANTIETNFNELQQQERSGMGTTIDRPPLTSPSSRQTLDRVKNLGAGAAAGKNPNPGGYTPGHVYGGLTYLGGDVNQRSSWK